MMLDAIGSSQLAMDVAQLKLQTVNNNVANANTPGFKKALMEQLSFNETLQPSMTQAMQQVTKDELPTQGNLVQSNTPHDVALSGVGYFQVQGEQGIYYTRRGDFHLSSRGELISATGEKVLGNRGTIQIDNEQFSIDKQGVITVDQHKIDQLQIAQFDHPELLQYVGNGLYQTEEAPTVKNSHTQILQGASLRPTTLARGKSVDALTKKTP